MEDERTQNYRVNLGGDSAWGCLAWVAMVLGLAVVAYLWHIHGGC